MKAGNNFPQATMASISVRLGEAGGSAVGASDRNGFKPAQLIRRQITLKPASELVGF